MIILLFLLLKPVSLFANETLEPDLYPDKETSSIGNTANFNAAVTGVTIIATRPVLNMFPPPPTAVVVMTDKPVSNGSTIIVPQDNNYIGMLSSDTDIGLLGFSIKTAPLLGDIISFSSATGLFVYSPDTEALGLDSFQYSLNGGNINTVYITIEPPTSANTRPTAYIDTGEARLGFVGREILLDGQFSSDAYNDPVTYRWDIVSAAVGSSISLSFTKASQARFTPRCAGIYIFSLIVNDGIQDSKADQIKIQISIGAVCVPLDVDGDGDGDANDGLIIQRRLTGASDVITGIVLPTNVGGSGVDGARSNTEILQVIDTAGIVFDVDGDMDVDANDGLMIQRRLTGASNVTSGIILPEVTSSSGIMRARLNSEILVAIDVLLPPPPLSAVK
ncbi:MAG: hypothetical protein GXP22_04840 [Gammaproteobacteria bacterium]|nr:hypothetical protein [Gammaproteobacteria bacterium]